MPRKERKTQKKVIRSQTYRAVQAWNMYQARDKTHDLLRAAKTKAPQEAIYFGTDNVWHTLDELTAKHVFRSYLTYVIDAGLVV